MLGKTWWPPNGGRSVKFNPKPIKPRLDALKIKSTKNIQAIKLNILNGFYQNKSFEIFKQAKFENEQLIRYFLFQFQFHCHKKWVGKFNYISQITFLKVLDYLNQYIESYQRDCVQQRWEHHI